MVTRGLWEHWTCSQRKLLHFQGAICKQEPQPLTAASQGGAGVRAREEVKKETSDPVPQMCQRFEQTRNKDTETTKRHKRVCSMSGSFVVDEGDTMITPTGKAPPYGVGAGADDMIFRVSRMWNGRGSHLRKQSVASCKAKRPPLGGPCGPPLGICSQEAVIYVHTQSRGQMFAAFVASLALATGHVCVGE